MNILGPAMVTVQDIANAAVAFALAERDLHVAEQACGRIRERVPPGVMPPASTQRELEAALAISKGAFRVLKEREAEYKAVARKLLANLQDVRAPRETATPK